MGPAESAQFTFLTPSCKGRFQNPQARKLSVGGVPPPRGLHGREFSEKLAEKVNGKGGYPPPLHGRSASENGNFFAENGVFCPKNTVFGPIFNGFFLNGKGGYPPPPPRTVGSRKPNGKKLTEKGG